MDSNIHFSFNASDRSYLSILKKQIHAMAVGAGFSANRVGELDIIVAELTSNLIKHADNGVVLAKTINEYGMQGLEIISVDTGPGITDVNRMLSDGVSTKNTLGHGLGAIKRMSDAFQIYSLKDWGTIMLIRVFNEPAPLFVQPPVYQARQVVIPKTGEKACGDRFFSRSDTRYVSFFLGDGLGHGPEAETAVLKAGQIFMASAINDPVEIIREMNLATKKTRGLVGTVVVMDMKLRKWNICGVGNIMTRIISGDSFKTHISYNGIIGMNIPNTLNPLVVDYSPEQCLVMCSDGIKSRWDLQRFPALLRYDLSILSTCIVKDFNRNTDDVSVAACKLII